MHRGCLALSRQNLYLDLLPVLGGPQGVIRGPAQDGRVAPVLRDDVVNALAGGWISTYAAIAAGEFDVVTDHVEQLTGHRPVGVREFLSRPQG